MIVRHERNEFSQYDLQLATTLTARRSRCSEARAQWQKSEEATTANPTLVDSVARGFQGRRTQHDGVLLQFTSNWRRFVVVRKERRPFMELRTYSTATSPRNAPGEFPVMGEIPRLAKSVIADLTSRRDLMGRSRIKSI
jgi:hypothetical protein